MKYSGLRQVNFHVISLLWFLQLAGFSQPAMLAQEAGRDSSMLRRRYQHGERFSYKIKAVNKEKRKTIRYEAQANCIAQRDSTGRCYETISWSDLIVNESRVPAAALEFRQICSLDPAFTISVPDYSKVNPFLIGPITDLIALYADLRLAIQTPGLLRAGDRIPKMASKPNSWGDGIHIRIGENQTDVEMTLKELDSIKNIATLLIRHLPPASPDVTLPAEWMRLPVDSTRNNWVQVSKDEKGIYVSAVGNETFDVEMQVSTITGALLSARMDNLIDVLQRDCIDSALTQCGDTTRYNVRRHIELENIP
jgi:hypothetical protein